MARKRQRIIDLTCEVGQPLTTGDIAQITGLSGRTIQRDIIAGELKAERRSSGSKYRVPYVVAREYIGRVCGQSALRIVIIEGRAIGPELRNGQGTQIPRCGGADCTGLRTCRECRRIYMRLTRPRHSELSPEAKARANARSYANEYQRRGKLTPKPCEVCGSTDVEKHHDDYSQPLQGDNRLDSGNVQGVMSLPEGRFRYFYSPEERALRVDETVLKCVGFIGRTLYKNSVSWDGDHLATCFFVSMPATSTKAMFHCVVTAKHVIENLRGDEVVIVTNNRNGQKKILALGPTARWWNHPNDPSADVAVMPFNVQPDDDIVFVGVEDLFLTPENFKKYKIGVGDECFITGLFTYADGDTRVTPIVRHGNIAILPSHQVQTSYGMATVYLIEARSIGGLSGSPVFVRETVAVHAQVDGEPVLLGAPARQQLLGLIHGHWDVNESELNKPTCIVPRNGVNMGIGIVVPAIKILETINHPELVEWRARVEEEENKRRKTMIPKTDIAGTSPHDRFTALAEHVLSVPREEMERRERVYQENRNTANKPGPKPKKKR